MADYHVTSGNMAPILERIRSAQVFQDNGLAAAPMWIFESHPETMRDFLARMTERYGSAEQWALAEWPEPRRHRPPARHPPRLISRAATLASA